VVKIEGQNVLIKLNSREKKTVLRDENNLATQIEVEEDLQRIEMGKAEINMEIRKNHILEVDPLETKVAEVEEVEVEIMVTDHLETGVAVVEDTAIARLVIEKVEVEVIPLEIGVAEAETNTVTNLLEIEEEVETTVTNLLEEEVVEAEEEEVEAIMETAMVEIITEEETLVTNLIQAKNSMTERKTLVKNENLRIKVTEITNVKRN